MTEQTVALTHTPGPWTAVGGGDFVTIYAAQDGWVAESESKNAGLIAAAPDGLQANQDAFTYLVDVHGSCDWGDTDDDCAAMDSLAHPILRTLEAAIAKAVAE